MPGAVGAFGIFMLRQFFQTLPVELEDAARIDGASEFRIFWQIMLPLAGNARAKMAGLRDGFVKLFCRPGIGIVVGGVVVAPRASELIHPVAIAVSENLTADQLAHAFTEATNLTARSASL